MSFLERLVRRTLGEPEATVARLVPPRYAPPIADPGATPGELEREPLLGRTAAAPEHAPTSAAAPPPPHPPGAPTLGGPPRAPLGSPAAPAILQRQMAASPTEAPALQLPLPAPELRSTVAPSPDATSLAPPPAPAAMTAPAAPAWPPEARRRAPRLLEERPAATPIRPALLGDVPPRARDRAPAVPASTMSTSAPPPSARLAGAASRSPVVPPPSARLIPPPARPVREGRLLEHGPLRGAADGGPDQAANRAASRAASRASDDDRASGDGPQASDGAFDDLVPALPAEASAARGLLRPFEPPDELPGRRPSSSADPPPPAAPTIRVHIGRIEIRGAAPAPPPTPGARPPRAPGPRLGLADYLRGRR